MNALLLKEQVILHLYCRVEKASSVPSILIISLFGEKSMFATDANCASSIELIPPKQLSYQIEWDCKLRLQL